MFENMTNTEIYKRFTSESPKIFKRIIWLCLTLGGIGTALLGLVASFPKILFPAWIIPVATHMMIAGAVGAAISKMTVENKEDLK